jgi:hypothetical protein
MQIPEERGFIGRESPVRRTTLRAATALSVLVASLLFFLVVPVFPRELMGLFAIGLCALAYKTPTGALILMLLLALPGYLYQLSSSLPPDTTLPVPMVVSISFILLVLAAVAGQTGGALGIASGAIAAIFMLTPFQFLALPVLIGTAFFRTRGVEFRVASAILVFAVLYYPFLAINSGISSGEVVPIFAAVQFHASPAIPILGLHEVSTAFGQVMGGANTAGGSTYPGILADYWPLSFRQRLFPVGVIFCVLAGAGAVALAGTFIAIRWLNKRGINSTLIQYATPALSLLGGVFVFLLLGSVLGPPLDFASAQGMPLLVVGTLLVGSSGSLAEIWLRRRDRVLDMRDNLAGQARAIRDQIAFLLDRTRQTKERCYRMDTSAEEALDKICTQELAFAEQAVAAMCLTDLEDKVVRFQELQSQVSESIRESNTKLCQYYDEDRQRYNDCLMLAKKYGFNLGDSVSGPDFSQLTSMEYDDVLRLQINLDSRYQESAAMLAGGVKEVEEILCNEVDRDFKRTGIHIARNYFTQECCAEAIHEFLQELGDIERTLLGMVAGLDGDLATLFERLKAILAEVLMPTAVSLGDKSSVSDYEEFRDQVVKLYEPSAKIQTLPDIMRMVARTGEIGEIMAELSSRLGKKISDLEMSVRDKTPRGHNWDIDPRIQSKMTEISRTFKKSCMPVGIADRMSLLKSGPPAIESAAWAVKDYTIAHELLINYANIELILEDRLRNSGTVSFEDLPVKRKYSNNYLKLYGLKHPGEVRIEADTGRLARL